MVSSGEFQSYRVDSITSADHGTTKLHCHISCKFTKYYTLINSVLFLAADFHKTTLPAKDIVLICVCIVIAILVATCFVALCLKGK